MPTVVELSTGLVDNRAPSGEGRNVASIIVRVENNAMTSTDVDGSPTVLLEAFTVAPSGGGYSSQSTYSFYL